MRKPRKCPVNKIRKKILHLKERNILIKWFAQIRNNITLCEEVVQSNCKCNDCEYYESSIKCILLQSNMKLKIQMLNVLGTGCLFNVMNREKILLGDIDFIAAQLLKKNNITESLRYQALRLLANAYEIWPDSNFNYVQKRLKKGYVVVKAIIMFKYLASVKNLILRVRLAYVLCKYWSWCDSLVRFKIPEFILDLLLQENSNNMPRKHVKYIQLRDMAFITLGIFYYRLQISNIKFYRKFLSRFIEHNDKAIEWLFQRYIEQNKVAIIIFEKMYDVGSHKFLTTNFGSVSQIIADLKSNIFVPVNTFEKNVAKLCLLSTKCTIRPIIESNHGIELIVNLLKKDQLSEHCTLMLLQTMWHFLYSDTSIASLIKQGVLDFFMPKMMKAIGYILDKKMSPYILKYYKCFFNIFQVKVCKCRMKHKHQSLFFLLESYKYITIDMKDNIKSSEEENAKKREQYNVITVHSRITNREDGYIPTDLYFIFVCLKLLDRLIISTEFIDWLVNPIVIKPLLMHANHMNGYPNILLKKILQNKMYFAYVVQQGYVLEIQDALNNFYMEELSARAKTRDCLSMIRLVLQQGETEAKLYTAISIPFLIDDIEILNNLLYKCDALSLICNVLSNPSHCVYEKAVFSILQLKNSLYIYPEEKKYFVSNDNLERYKDNLEKAPKVKLILKDGTIKVYKKILYEHSDIFPLMINNYSFKTTTNTLTLDQVSRDGVLTLMLALKEDENPTEFNNKSIESLMEALLLADMYMMPAAQRLITIFMDRLDNKNINEIWCRCNKWVYGELFMDLCVIFFLTKMSLKNSLTFFTILHAENFLETFTRYVQKVIIRVLTES